MYMVLLILPRMSTVVGRCVVDAVLVDASVLVCCGFSVLISVVTINVVSSDSGDHVDKFLCCF